jgi:hypothetical protein
MHDGERAGPWPEPDEADARAEARTEAGALAHEDARRLGEDAAAVAADLDAAADRVVDELDDIDDRVAEWDQRTEAAGPKGVAFGVAGLNVTYLMILPALLVVGIYTFVTMYAIVKAVGSGSDSANPVVVMLGVVGVVALFVVLLGIGGWALGRAADPKKRR